jgi:radical SAM superfamily enzyme YgiQ (UPF0313 family)
MRMKVGFIHSPEKKFSTDQNYGLLFAPIWAYALSSYLKKNNISTKLFDMNIIQKHEIEECDLYFFSGINQDYDSINKIHNYVKNKFLKKTLIGGPIAWSFKKANELTKLNQFDHICIGDGELILERLISKNFIDEKIIEIEERFDLQNAIPMDLELINSTSHFYYGGVVEVSRGCPFLCEFCDIRVMSDNNKNHSKSIETIINELNIYRRNGINNIQLACDNFIGDLKWAELLVDEIIKNNRLHAWSPSFYTWLTINIGRNPILMKKMREAGFDNLFIGVESFNDDTLIETAKLQNTKYSIVTILRTIQSYGFVVVAGLIFGFDSDNDNSFDLTKNGILDSGLLSGDASLLTALPGTPLYRRMSLSKRLRKFRKDSFLGGFKYVTNIKYLMSKDKLINGYIEFSKTFMDGSFQYKRIKNFYQIIINSENFINYNRPGYTNINVLLMKAIKNPQLLKFHLIRVLPLLKPKRFIFLFASFAMVIKYKIIKNIGFQFFYFWLFIWVNAINKYGNLKKDDFDIESVDLNFDFNEIIPKGYRELATENIPKNKIDAQFNATTFQLRKIIELKKESSTS